MFKKEYHKDFSTFDLISAVHLIINFFLRHPAYIFLFLRMWIINNWSKYKNFKLCALNSHIIISLCNYSQTVSICYPFIQKVATLYVTADFSLFNKLTEEFPKSSSSAKRKNISMFHNLFIYQEHTFHHLNMRELVWNILLEISFL